MPAIGIDLGTTFSSVAVVQKGQVNSIPNSAGNFITPSCVAYTSETRLVGEVALQQQMRNIKNTIYDAKRILGMKFNDPDLQSDMSRWKFKVVEGERSPKIQVSFKGKTTCFTPEQISSAVLEEMKEIAETYIGEKVVNAVITVPAYFNNAQRAATKNAAKFAGLHVLGLINEPTAAALAFGIKVKTRKERNILVYDLGGGTFDVTILTISSDDIFDVQATSGNTHLGGQDFNERLLQYLAGIFARKHKKDFRDNDKAVSRLRKECEKAKMMLSSSQQTTVYVDCIHEGIDLVETVSRAKFDSLNEELFEETMGTVETALGDAKMSKDQIDDVILVGGSTRIPYIQTMLIKYFGKNKINKTVDPSLVVANGAALHAAFLSGDSSAQMGTKLKFRDVTPLSLGVQVGDDEMSFVVSRNTTIPCHKTKSVQTANDNQTEARVKVYEGEMEIVTHNHFLGEFLVQNIPRMPAGEAKIEVIFDIDENGVLKVSAVDKTAGNKGQVTIKQEDMEQDDQEIKRMIREAEEARREKSAWRQNQNSKNELEMLALEGLRRLSMARAARGPAEKIQREYFKKECEENISVSQNKNSSHEFDGRLQTLKLLITEMFPEK